MSELVSVVLPIYNVEKYLDRCIQSVVGQTYSNLEILLVDDGSPDNCPAMCDQWAEKDARIKVIHKKNAGLGMARNTGIAQATGEYICFFDSDDYVASETVEMALSAAKAQQADVVVFGMCYMNAQGQMVRQLQPKAEQSCFRGEELLLDFLPALIQPSLQNAKVKNVTISACNCLFSLDCIRKSEWRFASEREIISEDVYFLLGLYRYVNTAAVLEKALYYYCENDTSLTRTYRPDRFVSNKLFYEKCIELCQRYEYPEVVKKACMSPFLGNTIGALKQAVAYSESKQVAVDVIRRIADDPVVREALQKKKADPLHWKTRILFWAMWQKNYSLCYLLLTGAIFKNKGLKR